MRLGAETCGVSLPPEQDNSHSRLLGLLDKTNYVDISKEFDKLKEILASFQPEIVFHLAAQPLVRRSYALPVETFETNVIGTVKLLEAVRHTPSVRAVVAISSDKCYENREVDVPYTEESPMGGYDPYSASKGCMELVISSFRRSFFNPKSYGKEHNVLLASARAGNVIGGGDWAEDRLVPDIMKATAAGRTVEIRNPHAVRPWQHVLEPLSGYLSLGQMLLEGKVSFADGWNFGPSPDGALTVGDCVKALRQEWLEIQANAAYNEKAPHEAGILLLDSGKALRHLGWHCVWSPDIALRRTAAWYKNFCKNGRIDTAADLDAYIEDACKEGLSWTK
jgi:CDP-glucose 4,6-dehydratase